MTTVHVAAGGGYDILIAGGLLSRCGEAIRAAAGGRIAALIADETAGALYGATVEESLRAAGYQVCRTAVLSGEASKCGAEYLRLLEWCAGEGLTRTDVIVALGGGVTGDLAGFTAATYLRGVPLVQIPTTLLAMVDSSVGGKTAIDLAAGKNLAGAFYQPSLVLCDPDTLATLPPETLADGLAETVKYGMLADPALLDAISPAFDPEPVIAKCVAIKRDLVEADERDTGLRQLLNLGHTVGHAIEALSGFGITHGHAVAAGMAIVTRAAAARGLCARSVCDRLEAALRRCALPTGTDFPLAALASAMTHDKKRSGDTIALIVPRDVGQCERMSLPMSSLPAWLAAGLTKNA